MLEATGLQTDWAPSEWASLAQGEGQTTKKRQYTRKREFPLYHGLEPYSYLKYRTCNLKLHCIIRMIYAGSTLMNFTVIDDLHNTGHLMFCLGLGFVSHISIVLKY